MRTVSDYLYARASHMRVPLGGTFELSPVCNFACKMCYVRKTPAQIRAEGKTLIEWEQWLELAKECRKAGMLHLLLTGGEPFLYPNFRELYIELHKMGFLLAINTNGSMINEETMQWLKAYAPYRVNITLYGGSRETYGRICGNPDGYERAVWAIRAMKEAGIPVVINASMIPENGDDLEKIVAVGKELGINTRVATYMFPPARREREETDSRFTPEESADMYLRKVKALVRDDLYVKHLREELAKLPDVPDADDSWGESQEEYMRCRAGRSSCWISWEGIMTACAITPFPLQAYPFRDGFQSCWGQLTDRVRTTSVLAGCSGCPKKELCKPCVAMIHAETGDVNEKAPYLCELCGCIEQQIKEQLEELGCEQEKETLHQGG